MGKTNGKADVGLQDRLKEEQPQGEQERQVLENELPAADPTDGFEERAAGVEGQAAPKAEDEVQKLRAERDTLFDRLARLQAEFDNYRKRAAKENADYRDFAVADAARTLLPVIDNFSLALKNAAAKPEDLRKGVELIFKQLQDVLQKLNVERV